MRRMAFMACESELRISWRNSQVWNRSSRVGVSGSVCAIHFLMHLKRLLSCLD